MDIRTAGTSLFLVKEILNPDTRTKPRIPVFAQKPEFARSEVLQPFERALPCDKGVPFDNIARFIDAVGNDSTLDIHHIMIIRDGAVIADVNFGAYDGDVWHVTHSECKSITGLAIGILAGEGRLSVDTRIVDIFGSKVSALSKYTMRDITVRHLLEMTSGVMFNEAGSVTETDWVKCFLESTLISEAGKHFAYNSMNTYMLGAAVYEITGQTLSEYLKSRLFDPLGIENYFWERCPKGLEKGGWGLYIRAEDIAKIGQLVLDGGVWKGESLVSREWIAEAASRKQSVTPLYGDYDYGWQIWCGRSRNTFLFNGMFGQNVLGDFGSRTLIISNAGNNELFQQSNLYTYAGQFLDELPESTEAVSRDGRETFDMAVKRRAYTEQAKAYPPCPLDREAFIHSLNGRAYSAHASKCRSVGLYPLYAQAIQNNFTVGFTGLSFDSADGELIMTIYEGDGLHRLPVGFDEPRTTTLDFHGESQYVAVTGRLTTDEDDNPVLKLRVSFLETSFARLMKLFFIDGGIRMVWSESPGKNYLLDSYASLKDMKDDNSMLKSILLMSDPSLIKEKIESVFEPVTLLTPFDAPDD